MNLKRVPIIMDRDIHDRNLNVGGRLGRNPQPGGLVVQRTRISMNLALNWTRMLQTQLEMIRATAVAALYWPLQPAIHILQVIHRIHMYHTHILAHILKLQASGYLTRITVTLR